MKLKLTAKEKTLVAAARKQLPKGTDISAQDLQDTYTLYGKNASASNLVEVKRHQSVASSILSGRERT